MLRLRLHSALRPIAFAFLALAGCDPSPPYIGAIIGAPCTTGTMACGAAVTGDPIPVVYCPPGNGPPVFKAVMACQRSCESVAGDTTRVRCDGAAEYAFQYGACDIDGAGACQAAVVSTSVLTCSSGVWQFLNGCTGSQQCAALSSSPPVRLGCQ